jgi:hypothetical protein
VSAMRVIGSDAIKVKIESLGCNEKWSVVSYQDVCEKR